MIAMKASEVSAVVGGDFYGSDSEVTGPVFISSKECLPGSIFLAIKGANVDGHDYAEDAYKHGASLVIGTRKVDGNCIVVSDPIEALSLLAKHLRSKLQNMKVIGITGSQGKTTTKELLSAVLSAEGSTVATRGNNNNELGVPLTILRCTPETRFCIVEMGARHLGDIAQLAEIAQPQIGVVLRVAAAHIGEFGSLENIARAKSEMITSLKKDGIAILGDYDVLTQSMRNLHQGQVISFGESTSASIRATDIELRDGKAHFDLVTPEGRSTVALRLYGLHQTPNALAAAAVAHALGITTDHIAGSLSTAEMHAAMRMEVHTLTDLTLINDSYNASPDSMAAALRTLVHVSQERGGQSWAFLGNMRELGESSAAAHAEIGRLAADLGVDHLITINAPEYSAGVPDNSETSLHQCSDNFDALKYFEYISRGDVVLCKGSRSEKLEVVAQSIIEMWEHKVGREEDAE